MWRKALRVWVVYNLFNLLNDISLKWARDTCVWLYRIGGDLGQVAIALYFGKRSWSRYRAAVKHDELKEMTRQEARFSSSREVV